MKAGYTLPNTGSAVDSTVLLLLSLLMIAAGFILRKRALN
ncbi:LPXTG cell wall anchor domain-containing protein [Neobacillus sp. PS3-12]